MFCNFSTETTVDFGYVNPGNFWQSHQLHGLDRSVILLVMLVKTILVLKQRRI